ncbi:MAG: M1 family metallopeptidase, partial [Bacteroidota bacterium]|nr:M1 family metallopeptidase [Bacteroidota bacterium]
MKKIILISLIFISLIYSNKLFSNPADTVNIYHYEIFLDLHDITVPSIKGNCIISLNPQIDNLKSIKLDLLSLNVDSLKINNLRSDSYSYNRKNIDINFDKGFNRTDSVSINIYYHGSPVIDISNFGGFYFTDNYAFNLGVGLKANPPGFGRAWFPCIDDFRIKSTYDFHIKTSTKNKAICNGLLVSIDNNYVDNTNTYHWKINRLITSYLASVAVGNYTSINDTLNGKLNKIPVNIFVKPSDSANAVKSFVNLKSALNIFENLFGPYKWERIGYVGVPFTDGAMEHASNIAIPESLINGTINNEHVFYHELSHHWFGDLVTCAMPEDMWLNEGWATYCESLFSEYLYGNKAFKDYQRGIHHISIQLSGIIDSSVFPVFNPPQNYTYGVTTYYKGNDVVHSLRNYIGDSLFFSTIRSYMKDYSYKNISTDQFRKYFENKTNINLKDFFDNWLYTAGFPHFSTDSFTVNPNGKKYDITVFFRQKLSRRNFFSNSNKIEVSFMDKSWNIYKDTATISGEYSSKK